MIIKKKKGKRLAGASQRQKPQVDHSKMFSIVRGWINAVFST